MTAAARRLVRIALTGLLVTTTSACLISIGGCSSEEAAHFNEVDHYGGRELVPEDDGLGSCGATFRTSDDPTLVIEHYRSRLEAAGWSIDPPLPSPPPLPEDGIEMQSVWLGAHKGMGVHRLGRDPRGTGNRLRDQCRRKRLRRACSAETLARNQSVMPYRAWSSLDQSSRISSPYSRARA